MSKSDFNKILLEAVDDALSELGDSARQSIYFHLRTRYKIAKNDIPRNVDDFEDGLEKIFGSGARFLEILIMKRLHKKIGYPLKWNYKKELVFIDYVVAAKRSFLQKGKASLRASSPETL